MSQKDDDIGGYLGTPDTMLQFFQLCAERKANTREERLAILAEMAKARKLIKQTNKQIVTRLAGKEVIHVKNNLSDINRS